MLVRLALPVLLVVGVISGAPVAATAATATPVSESAAEGPIVVANKSLADAPQLRVSGTIEVAEADATLNTDGTPVSGLAHEEVAFLLTDTGESIQIEGELPEGAVSGSTLEGTVAVSASVNAQLDVDASVLAAASTAPLAESNSDAQAVLASASTEQVAMPIAMATIEAPVEAVVATSASHKFYVAVVRPKGSPYSASSPSSTSVKALVSRVSKYWATQSGGVVSSISTSAITRYTSAFSCSNGTSSISSMWSEAAKKFSSDPNAFFSGDTRRHLVVLTPDGSTAEGWCAKQLGFSGLGTIGQSSASGGRIQSTVGSSGAAATLAHEFGHNLSLGHANVELCANSAVVEAPGAGCVINEYYDLYDVMGATVIGQSSVPSLSLPARQRLGFIADADVATVALDGAPESTTTHIIRPIASTSGLRGFSIADPITGENYWVELRTGIGYDRGLVANRDAFNVCVTTCPSWRYSYGDGVRILKQSVTEPRETHVIAAPATIKRAVKTRELALDSLDSFSSDSGGVHVDVNWVTSTAASVSVRLTGSATLVPSTKGMLVTGWATVGQTIVANQQFFRQPATQLSFQWLRDGADIAGATSSSYVLSQQDAATDVSVRITGALTGFAGSSVTSSPVTVSGSVLQRAEAQQPLAIVQPTPADVAGSSLTPTVILVSDDPSGAAAAPSLRWTSPITSAITTGAFDEDGVSVTKVPWVVGSVAQTVKGTIGSRESAEVEFTPRKAAASLRLFLSTSTASTMTVVKAYTSFAPGNWYNHPPTGTVQIFDRGSLIATAPVVVGTTRIELPIFETTGKRSLTAVYSGDVNFVETSSIVRSLTVS